eukprot:jgi/Bigna1/90206/estExt_fgenesh1_pg.C_650038
MDQSLIILGYLVTVVGLIVGFIVLRGKFWGPAEGHHGEMSKMVALLGTHITSTTKKCYYMQAEAPRPRRRVEKKSGGKKKKRRGMNRARDRRDEAEDEEEDNEAAAAREEKRRQEKEIRRQQREAMRKLEAEKSALRAKKAEKYAAKLAAKREAREAERAKKEKEEEERKKKQKEEEEAVYKKWAVDIEVEEEGTEGLDEAAKEKQLARFLEHIKRQKGKDISMIILSRGKLNGDDFTLKACAVAVQVVALDDLAMEYEMKTKDVIDHIETMEKEGKLTGIMDDAGGKFIYITKDEMKQVASFIKSKGRICIDDIVAQSNRIIDLNATAA